MARSLTASTPNLLLSKSSENRFFPATCVVGLQPMLSGVGAMKTENEHLLQVNPRVKSFLFCHECWLLDMRE